MQINNPMEYTPDVSSDPLLVVSSRRDLEKLKLKFVCYNQGKIEDVCINEMPPRKLAIRLSLLLCSQLILNCKHNTNPALQHSTSTYTEKDLSSFLSVNVRHYRSLFSNLLWYRLISFFSAFFK